MVSIIIPNYNHAPFLKDRIESVLNQTYQNFEVIILDDCSTDNSKEIIEQYRKNQKVSHILYNEKNSGSTFKQWNKGVEAASGKYIWIAESDDLADPLLLESLVEKLETYSNVGLAYCNSTIFDDKNKIIGPWDIWMVDIDPVKWKQAYINEGQNEIKNFTIVRNTIPNASCVVFRKSLYYKVGCADESYRFVGDWHLWVRMLEHMDVAYIADSLNYFRQHSVTTRQKYRIPGSGYLTEVYKLIGYIYGKFKYRPPMLNKFLDELFDLWHQNSIKVFWINTSWNNLRTASQLDPSFYYKVLMFLRNYIKAKALRIKTFNR